MKHTKGPWSIGKRAKDTVFSDDVAIADVFPNVVVGEANARLIAAAPELLEACRNALRRLQHAKQYGDDMLSSREICYTDAKLLLIDAIAKAEGRDE